MREAGRCKAKTTIIIGDEEIEKQKFIIKNMASGNQKEIAFNEIGTFFE